MKLRRVSEQLIVLVLLCALTYVPQFHIDSELQAKLFGILMMVVISILRSWTIKFSQKAIPVERRNRIEDTDLHTSFIFDDELWCRRCSKDLPKDQWVRWDNCKYRKNHEI